MGDGWVQGRMDGWGALMLRVNQFSCYCCLVEYIHWLLAVYVALDVIYAPMAI